MDSKQVARVIRQLAGLMELHGQNPFKIKSYSNAAFKISKLGIDAFSLSTAELEKIDGIGKSVAAKIQELKESGSIAEMQELLNITPEGVVSMLEIKGIGPKKVEIIWRELGIESIGELLYACNENRLIEAKGFGAKTQEDIRKTIEFAISSSGKHHYASAERMGLELMRYLQAALKDPQISFTGALRRRCEIIESTELLIAEGSASIAEAMKDFPGWALTESNERFCEGIIAELLHVRLYTASAESFEQLLFQTTGSEAHFQALGMDAITLKGATEQAIYQHLGLDYIEPEMREGLGEVEKARQHSLPKLIEFTDLKGSLHNHSQYSDGMNSLEEMAIACKALGYEYLGICDHSKAAFYANGLTEDRLLQQWKEIDQLNQKMAPFVIFKGIESDILNDGSLDYPEEILKQFDFIVASVHTNLKMEEEKATQRLIKAIENPYTTILGHPTGRLLLGRRGYPIDHQKVIDACAANNVVIELNANPHRLDIDWRWIDYALSKNVWISINADAHRKEGYYDMYYGTLAARKGGLIAERCFNAFSAQEIGEYFRTRKAQYA